MLIMFPEGRGSIDGIDRFTDLKINVDPSKHKARVKLNYLIQEEERPLDLWIQGWTNPDLSGVSIALEVSGVEQVAHITFNLRISFSLVSRVWVITGIVGSKKIHKEFNKVTEIAGIIKEFYPANI